jgi:hypothetical protein
MRIVTRLTPPRSLGSCDRTSTLQPFRAAKPRYISYEIAGEEIALLAAFGATDLHDHGLAVVGILREHQDPQLFLERGQLGFGLGQLLAQHLPIGVRRVDEQFAGRLRVGGTFPVGSQALDDGGQILVALRHPAQRRLVADHVGIAEAHLQRDVLVFKGGQPFEHRRSRLRPQPTGTTGMGSSSRSEISFCTGTASRAGTDDPCRTPGGQAAIGGERNHVEVDPGTDRPT